MYISREYVRVYEKGARNDYLLSLLLQKSTESMPPNRTLMQHTRPTSNARNETSREKRKLESKRSWRIVKRQAHWDLMLSCYNFETFCEEYRRKNMGAFWHEEKTRVRNALNHEAKGHGESADYESRYAHLSLRRRVKWKSRNHSLK